MRSEAASRDAATGYDTGSIRSTYAAPRSNGTPTVRPLRREPVQNPAQRSRRRGDDRYREGRKCLTDRMGRRRFELRTR